MVGYTCKIFKIYIHFLYAGFTCILAPQHDLNSDTDLRVENWQTQEENSLFSGVLR